MIVWFCEDGVSTHRDEFGISGFLKWHCPVLGFFFWCLNFYLAIFTAHVPNYFTATRYYNVILMRLFTSIMVGLKHVFPDVWIPKAQQFIITEATWSWSCNRNSLCLSLSAGYCHIMENVAEYSSLSLGELLGDSGCTEDLEIYISKMKWNETIKGRFF